MCGGCQRPRYGPLFFNISGEQEKRKMGNQERYFKDCNCER